MSSVVENSDAPVLPESVPQYFDVYNEPTEWHLYCLKCRQAYALKKKMPVHVGNVLALLNHARSHDT